MTEQQTTAPNAHKPYVYGPAYVYVIGPLFGPQKIGISDKPAARRAIFQTGHPETLIVSHIVEVAQHEARQVEQYAHRLLTDWHTRGEWFNVELRQAAEAVNAALEAVRCGTVAAPISIADTVRVPVLLSKEEVAALDDWQHENRIKTRSDAIRELIRRVITEPADKA